MQANSLEVIIPAYNEAQNIGDIIRRIRAVLGNTVAITVVDDASIDQTKEKAIESGAAVIKHPYRMGNGACVKTGIRHAKAEVVALMDGDGQHAPEYIPALLAQMDTYDMVIGARKFSGISLRNLANIFYALFASYVTQFNVQDLTSGFRLIRRQCAMKFLYLLPNGFSYPTTITLAFLKSGRTIRYVQVASAARRHGKSKIHLVRDGTSFFLIIIRIATFFAPARVFLPVSGILFIGGLMYYLHTYMAFRRFTNMSVLLFMTALIIFMLGLISEQISQLRMDRTED